MTELAIIQMKMHMDEKSNISLAKELVIKAAENKAQIILLPELFAHPYFCQVEDESYFTLAHQIQGHPYLEEFQSLAAAYNVVLPISFFEKAHQSYFNSLIVFDADGKNLGLYRKLHLPDGPGYEEKFYFSPGNLPIKTWKTRYGTIGTGICWDQWFPEFARSLVLQGADLLLFPTAIGSEPGEVKSPSNHEMWQKVMIGHAVANSCYIAAANRSGKEMIGSQTCDFYGHSFIANYKGAIEREAKKDVEIIHTTIDSLEAAHFRAGMGFFRDRRCEWYRTLLTLDGTTASRWD